MENIESFFVVKKVLTKAEIAVIFNGDDFGRALLAIAADLVKICLQCVVGVASCGCSNWNKKSAREKRYNLSYMCFILIEWHNIE